MKHLCCPLFVALALAAVSSGAEPVRKLPNTSQVDLEAAAKATAALYARMPSAQPPGAPAPVTTPSTMAPAAASLPDRPLPSVSERHLPWLQDTAEPVQMSTTPPPAGEVWAGGYQCNHAEKVSLRPGALADHVELRWRAQRWQLRRTESRSSALRLEDASARMVWIQLPNKSMLLDQRQGRRLLDDCQHDVQIETAAQMKANPAPALFDTTGMGR